jgi:hypothetical protein
MLESCEDHMIVDTAMTRRQVSIVTSENDTPTVGSSNNSNRDTETTAEFEFCDGIMP